MSDKIWNTMDSAPRDGSWFLVLRPCHLIGGRIGRKGMAIPELIIVRRFRLLPESGGYWENTHLNSIADSYLQSALWAPLEALPLVELYDLGRPEGVQRPDPLPDV